MCYHCNDRWDFKLCYKCYAHKDVLHPEATYTWEPRGVGFDDNPIEQQESSDDDSDADPDSVGSIEVFSDVD